MSPDAPHGQPRAAPGAAPAGVTVRDAGPADVPGLLALVAELADFERLSHEAVATEAEFRRSLFGPTPRAHALLAEHDGQPVGLAVFFFSFSTFTGRPSLHVEDVFVRPPHRGQGLGRHLFGRLAQRAVAEGCGRMEWCVLDWNQAAIGFYQGLGAAPRAGWTTMRVMGEGEGLSRLAGKEARPEALPLDSAKGSPLESIP